MGEVPEKTTKQTIDWSKTPPPTSPLHGLAPVLFWVVVGILVLGGMPLLIRWGQQSGLWRNLTSLKLSAEPEQAISVLESADSGVLLTVDHRGIRQVEFVISGTLHTVELSQGVANSSKPVISPRGDLVAFVVVEGGKRKVKIAPIQKQTFILTDDDQIASQGTTTGLPGLSICDDSLIKWSPDGTLLALLACTKEMSTIVIVNTTTQEVQIVPKTRYTGNRLRSFAWLGNTRILFVEPTSANTDQAYIIDIDGDNKILISSSP